MLQQERATEHPGAEHDQEAALDAAIRSEHDFLMQVCVCVCVATHTGHHCPSAPRKIREPPPPPPACRPPAAVPYTPRVLRTSQELVATKLELAEVKEQQLITQRQLYKAQQQAGAQLVSAHSG